MPPTAGTPAGRFAAVEAGAQLQYLISLDDLWTSELESASERGKLASDDIEMLSSLVGQMRTGLEYVPRRTEDLSMMLEELDNKSVEAALSRIVDNSSEEGLDLRRPLKSIPGHDLRDAAISACVYIGKMSGPESELLEKKLGTIREAGYVPPGDFRLPFRCAALLALVGAGAVASIGLGGAPVFIGMAVASQVGLGGFGWVGAKCPSVLPDILKPQ